MSISVLTAIALWIYVIRRNWYLSFGTHPLSVAVAIFKRLVFWCLSRQFFFLFLQISFGTKIFIHYCQVFIITKCAIAGFYCIAETTEETANQTMSFNLKWWKGESLTYSFSICYKKCTICLHHILQYRCIYKDHLFYSQQLKTKYYHHTWRFYKKDERKAQDSRKNIVNIILQQPFKKHWDICIEKVCL